MDSEADTAQNAARLWLTPNSEETAPLHRKVIPPGMKVFFRWANRTSKTPRVWGPSEAQQNLIRQWEQNGGGTGEAQSDQSDDQMAPSFDVVDFFESPLHTNVDGLFSAVIVLLSMIGLILVLLLAYFLVQLLQSGDGNDDDNSLRRREEGSPRHRRELRVVLVPKKGHRKSSLPSALIHTIGQDDKKHLIERKASVVELGHQPTNSARPFPKRIYELQAEEGYFSCPPSMRASFELD